MDISANSVESENTFNVDQVTLACLVSSKHKKALGEMNSQYASLLDNSNQMRQQPATNIFYDTVQENRSWLLSTFESMLDDPTYSNLHLQTNGKIQYTFQQYVETLLRDRERSIGPSKKLYADAEYDYASEDENEDEPMLFGNDCKDLRKEDEARQPSNIEYWKMQQVFRTGHLK